MRKTNCKVIALVLLALLLCLPAAAVTRRGDRNGDGRHTVIDALLILKDCVQGVFDVQDDMNGDGEVSLSDVVRILKYAEDSGEATQNTLLCSPTKSGIYNYCPSVMQTEDGTRYLYYCTNRNSYEVVDYIGCRKGTPNADGSYTYGAETIVLQPTEGQ